MFLISRPAPTAVARFLRDAATLPLSYGPAGLVREPAAGLHVDEASAAIGRGPDDFAFAVAALRAWKQFDVGWVELHPQNASIETGTNVAVLIRHFGFWSLNGCRVVYQVGGTKSDGHFGYAYGTLPTHAERGEELFQVRFDPATQHVIYTIQAVAQPRALLARIGNPLVEGLRAKFRRDSIAAMRRAVRAGYALGSPEGMHDSQQP